MRVLVVGGTGLIGSHAAMELMRRGHEVTVMARKEPDRTLAPKELGFVPGDYVEKTYDPEVFRQFDGLVFATGLDWRLQPKIDAWDFFRKSNVEAIADLFRVAAEKGVKRAVLVSSFYHAVRPALRVQAYIRSRFESEDAAIEAGGNTMNVSCVAPSWVMGPIPWSDVDGFGKIISKMVYGNKPLLFLPGGTNWISATTLGSIIAEALERAEHGTKYLAGGVNRTWQEVIQRFVELSGQKRKVRTVPRTLLFMLSLLVIAYRKIRGRNSGWRETSWVGTMSDKVYFEPTEAQKDLGYVDSDIDSAIAETHAFYRQRFDPHAAAVNPEETSSASPETADKAMSKQNIGTANSA
ncbi:MAG: NAD-dependent epimerase/dehydratase family protein [Proteobacteria bacterium]|nr:NAD-dependent epimerase/dehydratase family protein [Pseudomonadota bacterium]